jgi:hypothetical protein
MRRIETMTAGGMTLAGLGAIVGLAIGSGTDGQKLAVQSIPAVEVRTEVVRRTVNVYRHERSRHAGADGTPGRGASGTSAGSKGSSHSARTRASGASPVVRAALAVTTRSSGAASAVHSGSSPSRARPLHTRTSGAAPSPAGAGTIRSLSTRTSGGGGDHEAQAGERDD